MSPIDDTHATSRPDESPIRKVLSVRNHNPRRSQIAQAFFERYGPEDVRAESAGTQLGHETCEQLPEMVSR